MILAKVIVGTLFVASAIFVNQHGDHFGDLDAKNMMRKLAHNQSPVNITRELEIDMKTLEPIAFDYKRGSIC